eukprot:3507430-Rhodomonas_salina.1
MRRTKSRGRVGLEMRGREGGRRRRRMPSQAEEAGAPSQAVRPWVPGTCRRYPGSSRKSSCNGPQARPRPAGCHSETVLGPLKGHWPLQK